MKRVLLLFVALLLAVAPAVANTQFYVGAFNTLGNGDSTLITTGLNGPPSTVGTIASGLGPVAFNNAGLAFGSGGQLYALSNDGASWYFNSVNSSTGASSQLFNLGLPGYSGLAYDSNNGLFYSLFVDPISGTGTLASIDKTTGTVTNLFGTPVEIGFPAGGGLAYDSANGLFYAVSVDPTGAGTLYSIDLGGASSTMLFGLGGGVTYGYDGGLTYDASSGLLYALTSDSTGLYSIATIDLNTSSATVNSALDYGYQGGIAVNAPVNPQVPEPSSMLLVAGGALGLWRRLRAA